MRQNILIVIYNDPEFFPPTLNALFELSKTTKKIILFYRSNSEARWIYPDNTTLRPIKTRKKDTKVDLIYKLYFLIKFTVNLYKTIKKEKPKSIIIYDSMPMLALYCCLPLLPYRPILWYHSHDVTEAKYIGKFSLMMASRIAENLLLKKIDIFTLPSMERVENFKMKNFHGKFFFLPNYPSLSMYGQFKGVSEHERISIIYQGTITGNHGIQELINSGVIQLNIIESFIIIGYCNPDFKNLLASLVEKEGLNDKIKILDRVSYQDLIKITSKCHIGLATIKPINIAYSTAATASNKIYEYAACGLPILYYDNNHYNSHLEKFRWAFPTDLSPESFKNKILYIYNNFYDLKDSARNDFKNELNFEKHFTPVVTYLNSL